MESKFKGSQAPWTIDKHGFIENYDGIVCEPYDFYAPDDHVCELRVANSLLIAAAPDLLEALQECQSVIEKYINQIPTGKIRNEVCDINIKSLTAIAKALNP